MDLGHDAMLTFPDAPGSGLVSTSRFIIAGMVAAMTESEPGAESERASRSTLG